MSVAAPSLLFNVEDESEGDADFNADERRDDVAVPDLGVAAEDELDFKDVCNDNDGVCRNADEVDGISAFADAATGFTVGDAHEECKECDEGDGGLLDDTYEVDVDVGAEGEADANVDFAADTAGDGEVDFPVEMTLFSFAALESFRLPFSDAETSLVGLSSKDLNWLQSI